MTTDERYCAACGRELFGVPVCRCKNEPDSDNCPGNALGHEADPRSIVKADGVEWVIDVVCKRCRWGGAIRIDPTKIDW